MALNAEHFNALQASAQGGDANSQYQLGFMYNAGRGVKRDYKLAAEWYQKAAEQDHASAQFSLGMMYYRGRGVAQNCEQAKHWMDKAAKTGNNDASEILKDINKVINAQKAAAEEQKRASKQPKPSSIADNRITTSPEPASDANKSSGAKFFMITVIVLLDISFLVFSMSSSKSNVARQAENRARNGDAAAQAYLGSLYERGEEGYRQDYRQAVYWYRQAANQGHIEAQHNLGVLYEYGRGVDKSYDMAAYWLAISAAQGYSRALTNLEWLANSIDNAKAQVYLGDMYMNGIGVSQNYSRAVALYNKAATKRDSDALSRLRSLNTSSTASSQPQQTSTVSSSQLEAWYNTGNQYLNDKNYSEALSYFRQAANYNYAPAQDKIGWMYQNGWGVPQSYTQAVEWFRKAANQGNIEALASMGLMYYKGWGVPQNYDTALEWYRKAAAQGSDVGRRRINEINLVRENKRKMQNIERNGNFPVNGTIVAETLSVRQSPSSQSARIKTLKTGHPVSITRTGEGDNDYWFYVKTASGTEGWVLGGYVSLNENRELSYNERNNRRYSLPARGYTDTSDDPLNLRNIPSVQGSQVVDKLDSGTALTAYEVFAGDTVDWYRVRTNYGTEGWVSGKYIELR